MAGDGRNNVADLMVVFGLTGDLARKMTWRALYRLERRKLLDCPILGVASKKGTVALRQRACPPWSKAAKQALLAP